MELTGQQVLPVSRDRVWSALLDPETLRCAIPGCESISDEGNGAYSIHMLAVVGPVKARFKGRMQQQDLQPPHRYTLSFEGDGGMAGFAKGSAEVELLEEGDSREQTRLNYRAQAQIGGRLAQIGSRFVDATAAKMSAQFFERLTQVIAAPEVAGSTTSEAAAGVPVSEGVALAGAGGPLGIPLPTTAGAAPGVVTVQMPAWTWAFTITVVALLSAWLATH